MTFNQKQCAPVALYTLNNIRLNSEPENKYLGVIIQSDLKFNSHINAKVTKAKQQIGMVKRALHGATENAKLLAYTSLCRPHLKYASDDWDPTLSNQISSIEMVQHRAVRFMSSLKGTASISAALKALNLETLSKRRNTSWHNILLQILRKEECYEAHLI